MNIMDERAQAILLFILFLAMCLVALYFYSGTQAWHDKYQQLLDTLTAKLTEKDKQIEKLENELKTYKDMERVIKIEQVHLQPRELECKFMLHERFVDDTERFKKIIISETARYIAEEIERDPYLCKVYHSVSPFDCQENIMVHFRMLPYAEGVVWEDLFKKEED